MTQRVIEVIGSLNIDFITRTPRIPEAGETLTAHSFDTGFGGKGANQAVACARLAPENVEVRMVGKVGDDRFGHDYIGHLETEGIHADSVALAGDKTGVSNIIVDDASGENRILFTGNANYVYSTEPNAQWDKVHPDADVVIFQLEIPLQVVLHNMHKAREEGKHIMLNPAPASLLPDFAYQDIDTLIMNETESEILAGPQDQDEGNHKRSPEELAPLFLKWGVKEAVIITLGGEGLVYATSSGKSGRLPAREVNVVDTTAAGDTFVGAYAVKRVGYTREGDFDYQAALEFATLAASKSVERQGAMAAIPYLNEL